MENKTTNLEAKALSTGPVLTTPKPVLRTKKQRNGTYTNSTHDHGKAQSYFYDDAAATMRNECNRAAKNNQWEVTLCALCTNVHRRDCFHVICARRGYLCL